MIMISSGRICSLWLRTAMVEDGDQGGLTISSPDFSEGCCVMLAFPLCLGMRYLSLLMQESAAYIAKMQSEEYKQALAHFQ